MIRYARLYAHLLRFSFSKALQFRVDFFFRIVMDCVFYATNIAFFHIVHRHTDTIAGWTASDSYIFVCSYLWLDAAQMTFLSNNMWWFPIHVNRGDLDYHLVRPVSTLFFVSLKEFAANSFVNLIIASGLIAHAIFSHPAGFHVLEAAGFMGLLATSLVLMWSLSMLFLLPVFWTHSGESLRQLFFSLEVFGERPHRVYPTWLRRILTSILPFAIVASYPTAMLIEGPDVAPLANYFGVIAVSLTILWIFWRRGLRAYSSASS